MNGRIPLCVQCTRAKRNKEKRKMNSVCFPSGTSRRLPTEQLLFQLLQKEGIEIDPHHHFLFDVFVIGIGYFHALLCIVK